MSYDGKTHKGKEHYMDKGCLIGKGMTAEVYEWEKDKILKLYYDWFPIEYIKYEADIGVTVHTAGVPAPAIYGIIKESGRNGLIYQRINGKSMLKLIEENPWNIAYYAKKMAQLHAEIHRGNGSKLPLQKDVFENAIRQSEELLKDKTERIIEYLYSLPDGDSVCHGDLHPDNIIASGENATAIDWTNSYSGNPRGDTARTCLMISSPFIPSGVSPVMAFLSKLAKNLIYAAYIKEYLRLTGLAYKDIDAWILPIAAARLREKIPVEEKWLLNIISERSRGLV